VPGTVGAPALNVSVDVPPAVTVLGLNAALVPFGTPLAPNETLSAEPLVTVVVIVDEALPPWPALTLAGLALMVKSDGGPTTVSATVVLWLALAAVPVTDTEYVPGAVALPTTRVSVDPPPAVTLFGSRDAVVPLGMPLALSATVSADPLTTAVEIADDALPPCEADTLLGLAPIEKSFAGGAVTVSVTVVL